MVNTYREECEINHESKEEYNYMKENLRLLKEIEEIKKETRLWKETSTQDFLQPFESGFSRFLFINKCTAEHEQGGIPLW